MHLITGPHAPKQGLISVYVDHDGKAHYEYAGDNEHEAHHDVEEQSKSIVDPSKHLHHPLFVGIPSP